MKKMLIVTLVAIMTLVGCGNKTTSGNSNIRHFTIDKKTGTTIFVENKETENIITENTEIETWNNSSSVKRWD